MRRILCGFGVMLAGLVLLPGCVPEEGAWAGDHCYARAGEHCYDVEVLVRTKYDQPPMEDCANSSSTDATLLFKMPNRLWTNEGCGPVTDDVLHVLCGNETLEMELVSDINATHGATWETGDVTSQASNAFLSVYRTKGKSVLDFRFDFSSNEYPDPGCSGENITSQIYATSYMFNDGLPELWVEFSEIELSLGVPFEWTGSWTSEDSCDIGCYTTVEVTAKFTPVN